MAWNLTGVDPFDPRPGTIRELRVAQGAGGAGGRSRQAVAFVNMATGTGSSTLDGRGDALNVPRLITERQDVIDRFGYHSEALGPCYDVFRRHNTVTDLYLVGVVAGTGAASIPFTFANSATASNTLYIDFIGERVSVPVANGDNVTTIAAAAKDKINAQLHWPATAANASGVLTVTCGFTGSRGDYYMDKIRFSWARPAATTITKGSLTAGSADDDQTNAILGLEGFEIYYQINPKTSTSSVTSTDNGIGEHVAALATRYSPQGGKAEVIHFGAVGTNAQAITLAQSVNYHQAFPIWAEANDYSPLMLATTACAVQAYEEAGDRGCPIFDYGPAGNGKRLDIPAPFANGDRATPTELKAALNGGVTPVEFSASGKAKLTWQITSRSLTNGVADYRARMGHMPSCLADYWESLRIQWTAIKQLRIAETEKYAHVTYFFNGGLETPYKGEERILVPSQQVATYDLAPEMSAHGITDVLCSPHRVRRPRVLAMQLCER